MKRTIDLYFHEWKASPRRKPMILRGARQVGKTHAVRKFGQSFEHMVEVNLEFNKAAKSFFQKSLDPNWLVRQIALLLGQEITVGNTLLFRI